jgi:hypothetical protein
MRRLVVLSREEESEQARKLIRFAEWMGVPALNYTVQAGEAIGERVIEGHPPESCVLAISACTLEALQPSSGIGTGARAFLKDVCTPLLIFNWSETPESRAALTQLSDGAISGVFQIDGPEIEISFPENSRECSRQFAGLSYRRNGGEPIAVFKAGGGTGSLEVVMTADDRPMFVRQSIRGVEVFLLAGAPPPDLDDGIRRENELRESYHRVLPVLIFLRHCFAEDCWQNPKPTARLIIDDPLLTRQYGYLNFPALIESMHRAHYGTSLAFIPWNAWRVSRREAKRLIECGRLSLCIHGCHHANKEFEALDAALLGMKAAWALRRMESMHRRTDAQFEPVMVFPQERYSTAAITAIRNMRYLAAANTIRVPIDSEPGELTIRDFLMPAITRFEGFPIFQRRYPRRLIDFAFDLFLGKPALIVEHHEYFRDGFEPLEGFVRGLHRIEPRLEWPGLSSQLEESCLRRRTACGATEVRFFTARFRLTPHDGRSTRFLLSKAEPDPRRISAVLVDGMPAPFGFEEGLLKMEVEAEPGASREIEIVDGQSDVEAVNSFGLRHHARVMVRRALSEFRDNTLSRHTGLQRCAQWVVDSLGFTSDGYDDEERYEA